MLHLVTPILDMSNYYCSAVNPSFTTNLYHMVRALELILIDWSRGSNSDAGNIVAT